MSLARPRSLRHQLLRLMLLAVVVALAATIGALVVYESTTFRPRALAVVKGEADVVAQVVVPALEFDDARTAGRILTVLRNDPTIVRAAVYYADGTLMAHYGRTPAVEPPPATRPAVTEGVTDQRLLVSAEVRAESGVVGHVTLEADLPGWTDRVRRYGWILLLVSGSLVVLAAALLASIRRQITNPLQELAATVRRVGRDRDLELRVPESGPEEIGTLAQSFNGMLEALRLRDRRLQDAESRLTRQNAGLAEIVRMENPAAGEIRPALDRIATIMAQVLVVERVSIWLFNEDRSEITCQSLVRRGQPPSSGQRLARAQFPVYFAALDDNHVIAAADVAADARTREFAGVDLGLAGVNAMLDIPVRWRGAVAGVICNEHVGPAREWQADEIAFVSAAADHVVLLLEQRESQRAGSSLRESEDRFRHFISQARDAIFTISVDGRIESVNAAAGAITGWDMSTWLGRRFQRVLLPEDVAVAERSFRAVMAGAQPPVFELRIRGRNGRLVTFEFSVSPLVRNGRVAGLLGIGRDVTERREAAAAQARLEDQLRRSQKMEAIGNLAGGIAHDFNNILTAILGNAVLADADLAKADAPVAAVAREYVEQILLASNRAKELVQQILAFSRRQEQRRRRVHVADVVRESMKLLRPVLPSSVEIRTDLPEGGPLIEADPTQLHQVIVNLATNAAHAMEEQGGVLTIHVGAETFGPADEGRSPASRPGSFVRLTVHDTGTGMSPETLLHLFEPFFTTKEQGKGTGLGLAVVHGIVQQHDGWIDVRSQLGEGTTFDLFFPTVAVAAADCPLAPVDRVTPGGGETILVIDDEEMVLKVARLILLRANYQVETHREAAAALEAFRANPGRYAVAITDLTMPQMKGTRIATELRAIRPDLPVILATGFSGALAPDAMRHAGLLGPLQKPFTMEALTGLVAEALNRSRPVI